MKEKRKQITVKLMNNEALTFISTGNAVYNADEDIYTISPSELESFDFPSCNILFIATRDIEVDTSPAPRQAAG
jgi:hypothetical protein